MRAAACLPRAAAACLPRAGARRLHHEGTSPRIPLVDISPFLRGTAAAAPPPTELRQRQRETAAALGAACEQVGFFYVTNHGVDADLVAAVQHMARRFFEQDEACKSLSEMQRAGRSMGRGYQKLGQNVTKGKRDQHEAVDMFREFSAQELADPRLQHLVARRPELQQVLMGRNIWPAAFDRALTERYVASMHDLGAAVMRALALSLGLPQQYFDDTHLTDDPFWILRFIHYPAAGRDAQGREEEGLGCGAHTDYGCLTIVCQDDTRDSLQVYTHTHTHTHIHTSYI